MGFVVLLPWLLSCSGEGTTAPNPPVPIDDLPAQPVAISPAAGGQTTSDTPTFAVRNARGFDLGQATYTFEVTTRGRGQLLAEFMAPAGRSTTSAVAPGPQPRGMDLAWRATARSASGEVASPLTPFRLPPVACLAAGDRYAKSVVDVMLPFCPRRPNVYDDPSEVLGPPDAGGFGPLNFHGFLSLGDGGHVTVDMEGCAVDGPGADVRVYQAVGSEPVTLYAAGTPAGPFVLLEERKRCGERIPGEPTIRYCEFDLAEGEVTEARYFRVEDGERFPCELAQTPSEGADIDAVQLLNVRP